MYCKNCGNKVSLTMKFCPSCGMDLEKTDQETVAPEEAKIPPTPSAIPPAPVAPPKSPAPPSYASVKEAQKGGNDSAIRLILCTTRKVSVLKHPICYVIFYDHRLILAHFTSKQIMAFIKEHSPDGKINRGSFLENMGNDGGYYDGYGKFFYDLTPDEILSKNELNLQIQYSQITKFKFERANNDAQMRQTNERMERKGLMTIVTTSNKFKFTHDYYDYGKAVKDGLSSAVGGVLKYR